MSSFDVDKDVPQMALTVIPENATGAVRKMLIDAVSAGIMMERGRQRRERTEAAFDTAIASITPSNTTQARRDE